MKLLDAFLDKPYNEIAIVHCWNIKGTLTDNKMAGFVTKGSPSFCIRWLHPDGMHCPLPSSLPPADETPRICSSGVLVGATSHGRFSSLGLHHYPPFSGLPSNLLPCVLPSLFFGV